ncbi:PAS domain-containing sensor histidine kinase [Brevundimonas naejangsanensis]|uniref:histidine kinase n=1 Tax=Brevundimonas naejangsanensis TaxID=588932 RepID=A0A494RQH1_9CAUL|nr:PAS domain-containing sensor histidine kinase [Brevundimonas naejangsanensis]
MLCAVCASGVLILAVATPLAPRPLAVAALVLVLAATAALILAWVQARRLMDRLAARDAMLNAAFLSTPALTLTRDGAIRRLNSAAAALFDVAETAVRGRPFADLVPGFDVAAVAAAGVETGQLQPPGGHWTGRRSDGATFPLAIRFGLAPGAPDDEHLALGLIDLTLRHAAEAQARELHAQLNTVWRLNSLGEMAATLAHELNQPLSAATAYLHASRVDMEKAGPLGDSAGRTLDLAQGQLLRAGQIIRRMRAFLTQETGGLSRERAAAMVQDLGEVLAMIGRARGVALRIEVAAEDDEVQADRIQFQQAVVNLVRNGVEAAAGRAGAEVRVLGRADADGYRLSVEDNGPGVSDDQLDRIFQPMTSTKAGGLGLGLSVTRTIVERHRAGLQAGRSEMLGGAAFYFTLPRDEEARAA